MLFQSCVVYRGSTVAEVSEYENKLIKIKTTEGNKYKLRWIEEKNGNIISILNTKRVFLDHNEVKQIVKYHPNPQVIPLDSADSYCGRISIQTQDARGKYESHEFIQFKKQGATYSCYQMNGQDTLTVIIPLDQVEKIKVVNGGTSTAITILGVLGIAFLIMWIHTMSQLETT